VVINLTDKVALYNFFSTFRPRAGGVEPGFHF
jgi:hypothetical protein